jgi:hypothetical protein
MDNDNFFDGFPQKIDLQSDRDYTVECAEGFRKFEEGKTYTARENNPGVTTRFTVFYDDQKVNFELMDESDFRKHFKMV